MGNAQGEGRAQGIAQNGLHDRPGHGQPPARNHGRQGLGQADAAHDGVHPGRCPGADQTGQDIGHGQISRAQAQGQDQGQGQGQQGQDHDRCFPAQIVAIFLGGVAVISVHQRTRRRVKARSAKVWFMAAKTGLPTTKV